MRLTHIRDLHIDGTLSAGHSFLSAGSGLVRLGDQFCVVADDEHHLGIFTANPVEPGALVQLLPDALPLDAAKRKKVKPDFEILLHLPMTAGFGENSLLAIGSGSTQRRQRAAIIRFAPGGSVTDVRIADLAPLFSALAPLVPEVNLEAAFAIDDRLIMFNRGNMTAPDTHVLETSLSALFDGSVPAITPIKALSLPNVDGVPLTVTDACQIEDGRIVLSAVAEATADSYADGALTGAAILLLDPGFNLLHFEAIEPPVKIEGIDARRCSEGIEIFCVTDADDPDRPSVLYRLVI